MNTIYKYCNRCNKPIDTETKSKESDNSLELCNACATELYKKIYGEDDKE